MFTEAEYNKKIEYIFKQYPTYQKVGGIAYKSGLEGMIAFDKRLNHPHRNFLTIHVAGTNGKGSVSHMIASVLMECGVKCGLYTSPHLVDFRERIKVNGEMISKEAVFRFLEEQEHFMMEEKPSFFEITTAMAFDHFAREEVDIAIIETGLGGRLDSTNIIWPLLTIITNISIDHKEQLGKTISTIAVEKGGIIKEGVPIVVGEHSERTKELFETIAEERGAPITFASDYIYSDVTLDDYEIDLNGGYQLYNLRTLLTALHILGSNNQFKKLVEERWSDEAIREGLKRVIYNTGMRGRWEYLSKRPTVICDIGHNFNALSNLFTQLRKERYERLFCLVGFSADKEIDKILGLLPLSAYYFYTASKVDRALDSNQLYRRARSLGLEGERVESVEAGIARFKEIYREGDLLFIGGSAFVAGEAIHFFEKEREYFGN